MQQASQQAALPATASPIIELMGLAAPTVAQMASYTLMQFIDMWMLSKVSGLAATAAGNAGMVVFSALSFGMGTVIVVNSLVSQAYGARDWPACGRYLWQGVWFGVIFCLLLWPLVPFAQGAFLRFGHSPQLAEMELVYLRIVLLSTLVKVVATSFGQYLLATDRPNLVLISAIGGVACNAASAYGLIFGKWGFAPLGLAGSAWAQNIGVTVELTMLVVFASRQRFGFNQWRPRWREMAKLVRVGIFSGLQLLCDVLPWTIFLNVIMALFGQQAMEANNYVFRFWPISFMPAIGLGAAVTALVGRYIGMGRPDLAARRAHLGFAVAAVYMLICGLLFYFARWQLIGIFTADPDVQRIGAMVFIFASVFQFFDAMYIIYNGALRGAGDTLVPAIAIATLNVTLTIVGGYAIGKCLPSLGVAGPWTAAAIYGTCLGLFLMIRFRRGRWKSLRLHLPSPSNLDATAVKVVSLNPANAEN